MILRRALTPGRHRWRMFNPSRSTRHVQQLEGSEREEVGEHFRYYAQIFKYNTHYISKFDPVTSKNGDRFLPLSQSGALSLPVLREGSSMAFHPSTLEKHSCMASLQSRPSDKPDSCQITPLFSHSLFFPPSLFHLFSISPLTRPISLSLNQFPRLSLTHTFQRGTLHILSILPRDNFKEHPQHSALC